MTRLYIQPSFLNSCEEHGLWSGGNDQYRGDRSVDVATFDKKGRARVEAFSDQAIDSLKKRKTSIPLRQRILPQEARLNTLDTQIEELNQEYNYNRMSHEEYTQLKTILERKRDRAWELYVKAGGILPDTSQNIDESEEFGVEYATQNSVTEIGCGVAWIDELSSSNMFKGLIKKTCVFTRKAVNFGHKAKSYWNELKEV